MNPSPNNRAKALKSTVETLEQRFGTGALMRMGDQSKVKVEAISTGSMALDRALGIGGFPKGRVVEVFGPESSGKTTLALHAIAECQKAGGTAAFIDAEHALDVTYADQLGINVADLYVSQPDCGEQALEVAEALVRSGGVDLIVVDSVAALVPRAEIEGEMGDAHMGLQARLMSQALRKITAFTARSGCLVIFINQIRQKIGVVFGNGEVTTGGNALKFYASMRLDIRRIGSLTRQIDGEKTAVGAKTRIKVVKNKCAPPFQNIETEIVYGRGFCVAGEAINLGEATGVLTKSGSWYTLGDRKLGHGKEAVREVLYAEPKLLAQIRKAVVAKLSAPPAAAEPEPALAASKPAEA